jgi:hypothetical protein
LYCSGERPPELWAVHVIEVPAGAGSAGLDVNVGVVGRLDVPCTVK